MTSTLKLNLKENMLDSFAEGMAKIRLAESTGNAREYKFCVMHLFHFFELNLKYHVWLIDKHAIFSDGAKRKTITADTAMRFLEANGCKFRRYLKEDFTWLKELRNNIMHHEVSIDITHWRFRIPRILFLIDLFNKTCEGTKFEQDLSNKDREQYSALTSQHSKKLDEAVKSIIREHTTNDPARKFPLLYRCQNCDNHTATLSRLEQTFTCHYCGSNKVTQDSQKLANEYFCIIHVPTQYRTKTTLIKSKPEEYQDIETDSGLKRVAVPARYICVTKKKLVSPAYYVAKYAEGG